MAAVDRTGPLLAGVLSEYGGGSASFKARKEFFYNWKRSGDRLDITVSDYILDAPYDVLYDMGRNIAQRSRTDAHMEYPVSFVDYVSSDQFILSKRPIYLGRSRNIAGRVIGCNHDLSESLQRLYDDGLVGDLDIDNSYLSWCTKPTYRRLGFCSTLFRIVGISPILDREDVPEYVLDYILYHECLHLRQGFHWGHRSHTVEFHRWEHRFPKWREAESFLPRLRRMM